MTYDPFEPEMPPPSFVPPFDPPGSEPPYVPEGSSTDDDGSSDDFGPRPPWWPEDFPWPPEPEEPTVIESYPPIHVWPRLPPDHPYHVPPGHSAPDNLPPYLWQPSNWQSDDVEDRVRILAPFDPLVRDRDRFDQLWGWTYRFEAYVPAAKRVRGYYAMPVSWRDQVIGWANAKIVDTCLEIDLGFVGKRPRTKAFRLAAEQEVDAMADFLHLDDWFLSI